MNHTGGEWVSVTRSQVMRPLLWFMVIAVPSGALLVALGRGAGWALIAASAASFIAAYAYWSWVAPWRLGGWRRSGRLVVRMPFRIHCPCGEVFAEEEAAKAHWEADHGWPTEWTETDWFVHPLGGAEGASRGPWSG